AIAPVGPDRHTAVGVEEAEVAEIERKQPKRAVESVVENAVDVAGGENRLADVMQGRELVVALSELLLRALAMSHVGKGDHGAGESAAIEDRIADIIDDEGGPVAAPENLVG